MKTINSIKVVTIGILYTILALIFHYAFWTLAVIYLVVTTLSLKPISDFRNSFITRLGTTHKYSFGKVRDGWLTVWDNYLYYRLGFMPRFSLNFNTFYDNFLEQAYCKDMNQLIIIGKYDGGFYYELIQLNKHIDVQNITGGFVLRKHYIPTKEEPTNLDINLIYSDVFGKCKYRIL